MVDRIARCDPGLVRQAARRAPGCGDAVSYVPSDLHRARPQEPESSPRPIFLVADRLVQIWSSNEREFAELRALRLKVAQTRAYLASPGCNRLLGHACLERLETLRRKHLARLRANRRAGLETDGRTRCGTHPVGGTPVSLDLGSSQGLAYSRFAAALHAMLVRLASRSPAPILPPLPQGKGSASDDRPDPDRSWSWRCRQWKLHLLSPHLPIPPYEVDRGRENRAANDRSSRTGSPSPPAHIPIVLPTAVTGSTRDPSAATVGTPSSAIPSAPGRRLTMTSRGWQRVTCRWLARWPDA